jgi:hypothetical protein
MGFDAPSPATASGWRSSGCAQARLRRIEGETAHGLQAMGRVHGDAAGPALKK